MKWCKVLSYAKLNLHLRITGKKANGNHLLQMLSLPITLHDTIELIIHPGKNDIELFLDPSLDIALSDNLVYRAIMKYWNESPPGMAITIHKRIPLQAGLGGGSSNAASVLIAMNKIFQRYSEPDLMQLGFSLGADVPFFLQGKESIVNGEGEVLTPCAFFNKKVFFVIVKPCFSLSTARVYRAWDSLSLPFSEPIVFSSDTLFPLYNDLLLAANILEPSLLDILKDIRTTFPLAYSMTGSGSACFGVFAEKARAEKAKLSLEKKYPYVQLASPVFND